MIELPLDSHFLKMLSITCWPSLKLVPQSVLISFGTPLREIKRRKLFKSAPVERFSVTSKCMALIVKQVYKHMYIFSFDFESNGPMKSHPTFSNDFVITTRSVGSGGIVGAPNGRPWNLLHFTHLPITFFTVLAGCGIQYFCLIKARVGSFPQCALSTWNWYTRSFASS